MNPVTYLRYIAASALALAVDMGLFLAAMALGMQGALAAALGYLAGVVAHWLISSRAVFTGRVAERGSGRRQQQILFLGSALVGLALTTAIVGIGGTFGLDPRLAKLAAIAVSFQVTYFLRQKLVFAC
jgi:putative flippase GtrA